MSLLLSSLIYFSSVPPSSTKTENYIVNEVFAQDKKKCPEYSYHKNTLIKSNWTQFTLANYLLCFVYNQNIKIKRRELTITPFVEKDSVPAENINIRVEGAFLMGTSNAYLLKEFSSNFVIDGLLNLFDDSQRAWAAHVLLADMTGKYGIVFPYASTPEEWWQKEGKTGKAKKAWSENFFKKPGYSLYKKFDGYLFSCPTSKCEPPGHF